jgi:hypothetical protein
LKYFLGIDIAHSSKKIISQRKYTLDIIKKIGKIGCKPTSTPIDSKNKQSIDDDKLLEVINQFE